MRAAIIGLLFLMLVGLGLLFVQNVRATNATNALLQTLITEVHSLKRENPMTAPGTLHEEWWGYNASNVETLYYVDTKRGTDESLSDWYARHDADVATQRALHPAH